MTISLIVGRPETVTLTAPGVRYDMAVDVYYYSPPARSYKLLGRGTAPEDDVLVATLVIWEAVSDQPVVIYLDGERVEIDRVTSRYPKLTVRIVDQDGNPLDGVEVGVEEGTREWFSHHGYTVGGVVVFEIVNIFEPLHISARKDGYDEYPYWTYLGSTPPLKDVGDYEFQGSLTYTGSTAPPEYVHITVRVYDAYTKVPIPGATINLDGYVGVTDKDGVCRLEVEKKGYNIRVSAEGYKTYTGDIWAVEGLEVGIGLIPLEVKPPEIKLEVDREEIVEGEEVTFTVTPSNLTVELYELIDTQYNYIVTFTGKVKVKPPIGYHTYSVKYVYRYGAYEAEVWSNVVYVTVRTSEGELPPTTIPTKREDVVTPTLIPIPREVWIVAAAVAGGVATGLTLWWMRRKGIHMG